MSGSYKKYRWKQLQNKLIGRNAQTYITVNCNLKMVWMIKHVIDHHDHVDEIRLFNQTVAIKNKKVKHDCQWERRQNPVEHVEKKKERKLFSKQLFKLNMLKTNWQRHVEKRTQIGIEVIIIGQHGATSQTA